MDRILLNSTALFLFIILSTLKLQAQDLPPLSGYSEINEKIGYTDIKIEYSRPSARGRKIFGDLVSLGRIWRAGANEDTKITFSTDVEINNETLKEGSYSIFIKPKEKSCVFYFYQKSTTDWGGVPPKNSKEQHAWNPEKLKLEFEVPIKQVEYTETLTFGIQNISLSRGELFMAWEEIKVAVPFTTKSTGQAIKSIEKRLQEPTPWQYYDYANFYMGNSIKLKEALKYINIAINKAENSSWWFLRCKSQILAKLKRYDEAIETAKEGLKEAKKEKSNFYTTQSNNDIKRWINI
ncbi:DUF2911 domain-containing protein [Tenacibaculum sp. C7A-26P2]|uniref:DUF2911 domain-containing protein n=1 Tax=Tenacibaculum sp. C7A-26P2 TaxID=3447504 RepID=UPI003F84F845